MDCRYLITCSAACQCSFALADICRAKACAAKERSGRVTLAMYWMLPTALMNRECSAALAFSYSGHSFKLRSCCRGTIGVGDLRQFCRPYFSSRLLILVLWVTVMVLAARSRMISEPKAQDSSPRSLPSNFSRMTSTSSCKPSQRLNMNKSSTQRKIKQRPCFLMYRPESACAHTKSNSDKIRTRALCHSRAACYKPSKVLCKGQTRAVPSPKSGGCST